MKVHVSSVGLPLGIEPPEHQPMAQDRGGVISIALPDGATVGDLLRHFSPHADQVQKVLVNGIAADSAMRLKNGDAVTLVGKVSGL